MSDTEQTITELVHALRDAETLLNEHRMTLIRDGWSNVAAEFVPVRLHRWGGDIGFSGGLVGERATIGNVVWDLRVIRQDEGWLVERALNRARKPDGLRECMAELPPTICGDSRELARMLVPLVNELCSIAVPDF